MPGLVPGFGLFKLIGQLCGDASHLFPRQGFQLCGNNLVQENPLHRGNRRIDMVAGQAVGESEQGNSALPKRAIAHGGYQVFGSPA